MRTEGCQRGGETFNKRELIILYEVCDIKKGRD